MKARRALRFEGSQAQGGMTTRDSFEFKAVAA
ncbi:hypothetical protein B0I32_111192 [Nonomuraea fuscirosea]|uniref:Uncharacterized protein n=1 Tax=Nonomuraea fuscirosea TaxID=1291556 RepID=A0A2T0MWA3_9ACTN|nr:hypothetical protein B0I32_111192 [Nonomuraea fuscirosea]